MFDWLKNFLGKSKEPYIMTKEEEEALLKEQAEAAIAGGVPGLPQPDIGRAYADAQKLREELERERTKRTIAEENLRVESEVRQKKSSRDAQAEFEGKVPVRPKTPEEILEGLPEEKKAKYSKRVEAGEKARREAEFEMWEEGVPGKKKTMHRDWVPEQTDEAGKRVPGHYEYREVDIPLSSIERLAFARALKLDRARTEEELAVLASRKKERSFPVRFGKAVGGTVGGAGTFLTATAMMGVAGTAQAILPRSEPRKARGLVPSLPLELYGVNPTKMNLTGIKHPSNLGHLRAALLPRGIGQSVPRFRKGVE